MNARLKALRMKYGRKADSSMTPDRWRDVLGESPNDPQRRQEYADWLIDENKEWEAEFQRWLVQTRIYPDLWADGNWYYVNGNEYTNAVPQGLFRRLIGGYFTPETPSYWARRGYASRQEAEDDLFQAWERDRNKRP